jgi:hypothetical protein
MRKELLKVLKQEHGFVKRQREPVMIGTVSSDPVI